MHFDGGRPTLAYQWCIMGVKVKIKIRPANKIVSDLGIQKKGPVQRFLVGEIRRNCDPYVPLLNGPLKNTAVEEADQVRYIQAYSIKQYFENRGRGMRGKYWDIRMVADRGPRITEAVVNFINLRR